MMKRLALRILVLSTVCMAPMGAHALSPAPSRSPEQGCAWEKMSDADIGLAAWVQRCDFGFDFRRIGFEFKDRSLAVRYSDGGGEADPLVDVFAMTPGETPETAVKRVFAEKTDPALAARCVIAPYAGAPLPAGVRRFVFVPDAAYRSELDAAAVPDEMPPPACGVLGEMPDGVQYFETSENGARRILFVRVGQEAPLFDEQTLEILPSPAWDPCCGYEAGEGGVSADFLLETCSVTGQTANGMIPFFDCQSYVLAVLDASRTFGDRSTPPDRLCLPATLTAREVLTLMAEGYEDERDGRRRASDVILFALRKAYACRGDESPRRPSAL